MTHLRLLVLLVAGCLAAVAARGQSVFDMPRLFPQHRRTLAQFIEAIRRRDLFAAEAAALAGAKLFPNDANWHYNVACVTAQAGRTDEALAWLDKAIDRGFTDVRQLERDLDLSNVRTLKAFPPLLEKAKRLAAIGAQHATLSRALVRSVVTGTEAVVDAHDTQWEWDTEQGGYMTTLFRLAEPPKAPEAAAYTGPYAELVRECFDREACAGVLYVNRDEDLCAVRYEAFPGLTPVLYSEEAQKAKAHKGMANGLFSTGLSAIPVVGNASVMMGNTLFWRSIGRGIASDPAAMALAYRLAMANQLYVYDATPDYNAALFGDLLYAQNPAIILSADLSGKTPADGKRAQRDLTELILAALTVMPAETKQVMFRRGCFVPTMQRLLREGVRGQHGYLTPSAHPAVFDPAAIDGEKVIRAAHALEAKALPPALGLVVRQETMPVQFVDYFDLVTAERIADTPACITRIVRTRAHTRSITIEASSPERGLRFHWFALSGDPEKIRIRPLTANGALCTIEVDYQAPAERAGILSRRVEVACVAIREDGNMSAPGIVAFRYLGNERRQYTEQGVLQTIDYRTPESGYRYEDPLLTAFKNWQDSYRYDETGRLVGWERLLPGGKVETFDAQGRRLEGSPPTAPKRISYVPRMNQGADGIHAPALELIEVDAAEVPGAAKP